MSAGAFSGSRYESDDDEIHPIKVQPETISAVISGQSNQAPAGETTSDISAKVSRGNREYGLRPRFVSVVFTATVPDGYKADQTYRIPILRKSVFNAISKGNTGTYLGSAIRVVSKTSESQR